ncbi:MAG: TonB-dependent receptor [Tannerella sp.]|jgi:hypothetical protein|nr:TonB-dependent receptor [Tannerella sp.]
MKPKNRITIAGILILSGLFAIHTRAQDDKLSREMTLEREYDPTIQDANKINRLPEIRQPEIIRRTIEYSQFTIPANPGKEITILPSGEIMTAIPVNNRRGYFNFGGGMFRNLSGDLGYHFLNNEKDKLNFYLSHRSTNGNVEYLQVPGEKQKARVNDNLAVLDYRHQFSPAVLRLGGSFDYSLFNYYGLPLGKWIETPLEPIDSLSNRTTNQANQTIHAYAGIQSKEWTKVGYLFDFEFLRFNQKYGLLKNLDGADENKFTLRLGLSAPPGDWDKRLGITGKMDLYELRYAINQDIIGEFSDVSLREITVSPYYQITGINWKTRLGVNLMYVATEFGGFPNANISDYFVSPDITFEAEVANKTVFYANAGGEIQSNDPAGLAKRNRYMGLTHFIAPSYTWLDGMAGIRSGVVPGLWFDIFAGFKFTEKDVFFIPATDRATDSETDTYIKGFNNMHMAFQPDASLFRAGASLKYMYKKWVDFSLKGIYNEWSFGRPDGQDGLSDEFYENAKAYGRPSYEVSADLTVKPLNPLALTLSYYLGADRYTYFAGQEYKMKNINDLRFTASYNFNETFGVYLKLNNLLFQKQELWVGYPVQGFSAMAGINLNF